MIIITVKPLLSYDFVLDQVGVWAKNSRFLHLKLWTKIRITTKPREVKQTRMCRDAAFKFKVCSSFFHMILDVAELLYFFLLFHD